MLTPDRIGAFLMGAAIVAAALLSAVRTLVLPRSANDPVARAVFRLFRWLFSIRVRMARSYAGRDAAMALFAPITLLMLLLSWLLLVTIGFSAMFWAIGAHSWLEAFVLSGSSLSTLGFAEPEGLPGANLALAEATLGLMLTAMLIAYLPTIYSAFARRETAVTLLEVRAGAPPSPVELLLRYNRLHGLHRLSDVWETWEAWFADIEESHTSLAALAFFRSPRSDHSWVTAAGAVLDAAALYSAALDVPRDARADLCLRAGYIALRRIADLFDIRYEPSPDPGDPVSVRRSEFDDACRRLAEDGVPLKSDRDQAWRDFAGWRVNYDAALLGLAAVVMAPFAPWSSDRSFLPQGQAQRRL